MQNTTANTSGSEPNPSATNAPNATSRAVRATSTRTRSRRWSPRSTTTPAGNASRSHGSRAATATPTIRRGSSVSSAARSGKAASTRPSPNPDSAAAHHTKWKARPSAVDGVGPAARLAVMGMGRELLGRGLPTRAGRAGATPRVPARRYGWTDVRSAGPCSGDQPQLLPRRIWTPPQRNQDELGTDERTDQPQLLPQRIGTPPLGGTEPDGGR